LPEFLILLYCLLQVNLVEWLKNKVTNRDYEAILDPKLPEKPSSKALKKALLVALRCVDPDSQKRPKMGHVIHMLEVDDFPYREVSPVGSCFFTSLISIYIYMIKSIMLLIRSQEHTLWMLNSIPSYIW
jgi:hypothetical protein